MAFRLDDELLKDLSVFLGDDLRSIIDIFLSHSSDLYQKVLQACQQGDSEQAALMLHSFKGGAKNIGALSLAELCSDLEANANSGELNKVLDSLPAIQDEVKQLAEKLPRYIVD